MVDVVETPQVEALFGLILKRCDRERASFVRRAYFQVIADLRENEPWIWVVRSDRHPDNEVYVLYEPPIRVHFRRIHDGKIGIIDLEEMEDFADSQ